MEYQIGIYNNKNKQFLFVDDKILWKVDKIHMKLDRRFSKPDRILLIFESLLLKLVKTTMELKRMKSNRYTLKI